MHLNKLFRTSTFKLALIYLLLFGISVGILLVFLYWATAGYMAQQTDATIEVEITGLAEQYRQRGLNGLVSIINERASDPKGASLYLLTGSDLRPVVGNISGWPKPEADENGWLSFSLEGRGIGDNAHRARARVFKLHGNWHLLVGRDIRDLEATQALITRALLWGLAITVGLGLVGGSMMSMSLVKGIEVINQTCQDIMTAGDLSRRIPTRNSGDDFDQLAGNLNAMLDTIEQLMDGIRQVTDNIAHDLKTPLSRLRNRLEVMHNTPPDTAGYDAMVEQNIAEADRLLITFNALLRIARIESGGHQLQCQTIDPAVLVRDASELYEVLAQEKNLNMTLKLAEGLSLYCDQDLIFQTLTNLLDNAIKYTPPGGRLQVQLFRAPRDRIEIVVADNGSGIPAAYHSKVLQRFFRLEHSRSTSGNGLGLSLVAAVMQLHKASIRLEDNQPGLRAILSFPAAMRK